MKVLPSIIIYDDRDEQVTYTEEYYLAKCEIEILNRKLIKSQITSLRIVVISNSELAFLHAKLVGLCGTYEDGTDFIVNLSNDKQKTIMWIGSSIGNLSNDGANFIRCFQEKSNESRRNNPQKVATAYNDPHGISAAFTLNALNHLDVIFDQQFIKILILIIIIQPIMKTPHAESWSNSDLQYGLHLIYKPPFFFTRPHEFKGSKPTLEEWQEI
ncbi:44890_t:CDS:2 [Gigaspora margarita]|uniref:44890_t:CDS:1 n=1 Tax=Gigaspora margarita TaxID=4874 RepID=A0ABN7UJX0_GIGMA|nr:44890_t:CDS:2 [Gigaspora margarita]